jgi:uncharacterized protein YciI
MDKHPIESHYAPFIEAVRGGGFVAPEDGWTAELVAAHVTKNNDLIAEMAERIAAGEQPSYDNSSAVDEEELQAFADSVGGLAGLADALETSARRLAAAFDSLDEKTGGHQLPVVIHDSGEVVLDGEVEMRSFIEGNAGFHLEMHLAQLTALAAHRMSDDGPTAEPPAEFDVYQLVIIRRPESIPELTEEEEDRLQALHLGHLFAMMEAGHMLVAGPLTDQPDESWRGVSIYQVGSVEEARRLAEDEVAAEAGRRSGRPGG